VIARSENGSPDRAVRYLADRATELAVIERLRSTIASVLDPYVRPGRPYALLDFPNHDNIGDSAIWLGTLAYFRARALGPPAYVCTYDYPDFDELERRCPDGPIFLHGGGNFGDIWPWYQTFRQAVMARFPGRQIVQLPQTLHFERPESLAAAAGAIERHGNFVLLVRDRRSYESATSAFACTVVMCPDMAFCLGPLRPARPATYDLLLLLRTDRESTKRAPQHDLAIGGSVLRADWPAESRTFRPAMKARSAAGALARGMRWYDPLVLREHLYDRLADARVRRGLDLLSSGRYVIADRLHAHILALLLGIPHHALDNSYGKLAAFIDAWTSEITTVVA
jgi:pyruvyl transferase EpsO